MNASKLWGARAEVVARSRADERADEHEHTPRHTPASGIAPPLAEARVLLVDDDAEARATAADALRAAGFVVDEVTNGLDALKAFQARRPHIVLLEVMTPFVDGFSTCRAIREMSGGDEASIVLMTDLDDLESLRFGYDAGATDFITKPVNAIVLQHRMRYMLRSAELVDQLRRSQRTVAHLAYHDALTGLPNRLWLERTMARARDATPGWTDGALFLVDLDGFKRVNDTFGHSAGDELICEVGRRVLQCFGICPKAMESGTTGQRILARLGGDEFVLVDPNVASPIEASILADRILHAIGTGFEVRGHEIGITASIGVALVEDVGRDVEALLQSADAAMYDAKAHDRNNARFYSPVLSEQTRARLDIESALRHAIALNQLELHYQPKVDLTTSQVVGAEALIRWKHPERGMVPPMDFIGVAEETGLIVPIGRWVVREACRQARAWNDDPALHGLRIAVNVSARQFRDPRFLRDVQEILAETGVAPEALELEITEGTLMNDTKSARQLLNDLKGMGIWIALDDFGTGYSALGYLRQFPFDTLKVDRSFVADVLVDENSAAITGAVVAMANRLHLVVVAEGVETQGQVDFLRTLGCDQVQGYLYSRPLPASEFARWATGRVQTDHLEAPRPVVPQRLTAIPPIYPSTAPASVPPGE